MNTFIYFFFGLYFGRILLDVCLILPPLLFNNLNSYYNLLTDTSSILFPLVANPLRFTRIFDYSGRYDAIILNSFILNSAFLFAHLYTQRNTPLWLLLLYLMALCLSITDYYYLIVCPFLYSIFVFLCLFSFIVEEHFFMLHFFQALGCYLFFKIFSFYFSSRLGGGDIKILIFWCLLLNLHSVLWIIFWASFLAILAYFYFSSGTFFLANQVIPFVPFLTAGLFLVTLC